VTPLTGKQALYSVTLSRAPSPAWRAAFLRPPARVTTVTYQPELCRLDLQGANVLFRTTPAKLQHWLRRIDAWICHANSVVGK
jgi:hypothetical protein